jgi:hypothetical protein
MFIFCSGYKFPLFSDTVVLKSGTRIEIKEIEKETDSDIIITTKDDLLIRVEKNKIDRIEKDSGQKEKLLEKGVSIVVTTKISNTLIFRGLDAYQDVYSMRKQKVDSFNKTGVFTPNVYFNFKNGLYFGFIGNFAIQNRQDVDTDGTIQKSPGSQGYNPFVPTFLGQDPVASWNNYIANNTPSINDISNNQNIPKPRAELNGLRRYDSAWMGFGYKTEQTRRGLFDIGIFSYYLPNPVNGAFFPGLWSGKSASLTEIYILYTPPGVLNKFTWSTYGMIETNWIYNSLEYKNYIIINQNMKIDYGFLAGYSIQTRVQGFKNINLPVGFNIGSLRIGASMYYRPTIGFYDYSGNSTQDKKASAWITGGSTPGDGLIPDPTKNSGIVNQTINSYLASRFNASSFTPYQKIPRIIYSFEISYSITF